MSCYVVLGIEPRFSGIAATEPLSNLSSHILLIFFDDDLLPLAILFSVSVCLISFSLHTYTPIGKTYNKNGSENFDRDSESVLKVIFISLNVHSELKMMDKGNQSGRSAAQERGCQLKELQ